MRADTFFHRSLAAGLAILPSLASATADVAEGSTVTKTLDITSPTATMNLNADPAEALDLVAQPLEIAYADYAIDLTQYGVNPGDMVTVQAEYSVSVGLTGRSLGERAQADPGVSFVIDFGDGGGFEVTPQGGPGQTQTGTFYKVTSANINPAPLNVAVQNNAPDEILGVNVGNILLLIQSPAHSTTTTTTASLTRTTTTAEKTTTTGSTTQSTTVSTTESTTASTTVSTTASTTAGTTTESTTASTTTEEHSTSEIPSSTTSASASASVSAKPRGSGYYGCVGSKTGFPGFQLIESRDDMDNELCRCLCDGQPFAGTYKRDCYCGPSIDEVTTKTVINGLCNIPCPGNDTDICGGDVQGGSLERRQNVPNSIRLSVFAIAAVDVNPTTTASTTTVQPTIVDHATATHVVDYLGDKTTVVIIKKVEGKDCIGGICFTLNGLNWDPIRCHESRCNGLELWRPETCHSGCDGHPIVEAEPCTCEGGVSYKPAPPSSGPPPSGPKSGGSPGGSPAGPPAGGKVAQPPSHGAPGGGTPGGSTGGGSSGGSSSGGGSSGGSNPGGSSSGSSTPGGGSGGSTPGSSSSGGSTPGSSSSGGSSSGGSTPGGGIGFPSTSTKVGTSCPGGASCPGSGETPVATPMVAGASRLTAGSFAAAVGLAVLGLF